MNTCKHLVNKMCVRCLELGHTVGTCKFSIKGVCGFCLLPGRYKGQFFHHDGAYRACITNVTNTLSTLVWLIWNEYEQGIRVKMDVLLKKTDLNTALMPNKQQYFDWFSLTNKREY